MEKLINDMIQKTGIDRATAEKVAGYLKDNASRLPEMFQMGDGNQGMMGKISSKVSDVIGGARK